MEEILKLLNEKNECLAKFYELNEAELASICSGNFDNLERFYQAREGLLDVIEKVDEVIERKAADVVPGATAAEERLSLENMMNRKEDWVKKILSQDLEILSAIDDAKSGIIKDIIEVKTTRKAVSAYKSGNTTRTLDEEA